MKIISRNEKVEQEIEFVDDVKILREECRCKHSYYQWHAIERARGAEDILRSQTLISNHCDFKTILRSIPGRCKDLDQAKRLYLLSPHPHQHALRRPCIVHMHTIRIRTHWATPHDRHPASGSWIYIFGSRCGGSTQIDSPSLTRMHMKAHRQLP